MKKTRRYNPAYTPEDERVDYLLELIRRYVEDRRASNVRPVEDAMAESAEAYEAMIRRYHRRYPNEVLEAERSAREVRDRRDEDGYENLIARRRRELLGR